MLRKGNFREADIWLKVLSRKYGIITLFAFGGARSKRRFCGCLDVFNTLNCKIRFSQGMKYLVLDEASLLSGQTTLRKNWKHMGEAFNCLAFLEALDIDFESREKCFGLLEDMKDTLQGEREISSLFVLFFRFRLACLLGYDPELNTCISCGQNALNDVYFAYNEGRIYCSHCQATQPKRKKIRLPFQVLDLLRMVKQSFPSQWPVCNEMPNEVIRACSLAMDSFVQYHIGIAYSHGHFRHI